MKGFIVKFQLIVLLIWFINSYIDDLGFLRAYELAKKTFLLSWNWMLSIYISTYRLNVSCNIIHKPSIDDIGMFLGLIICYIPVSLSK